MLPENTHSRDEIIALRKQKQAMCRAASAKATSTILNVLKQENKEGANSTHFLQLSEIFRFMEIAGRLVSERNSHEKKSGVA